MSRKLEGQRLSAETTMYHLEVSGYFDGLSWFHRPTMISIDSGEITKVGRKGSNKPNAEVSRLDCVAVPGFHDSHTHLYGAALAGLRLELSTELSKAQVLEQLQSQRGTDDDWLSGRGWPTSVTINLAELDRVLGRRPVLIMRSDGHSCVVNSATLRRLNTLAPDVSWPNQAVLTEGQAFRARKCIPLHGKGLRLVALEGKLRSLAKIGVTSVQDDTSYDARLNAFDDYSEVLQRCRLARVYLWNHPDRIEPRGDSWVRENTAKLYLDGSFGSRTACLSQPYRDCVEAAKLQFDDCELLEHLTRTGSRQGIRWAFHCIGDETISQILRVLKRVDEVDPRLSLDIRLEHCLAIKPLDLSALVNLKNARIYASVQPISWHEDRELRETVLPIGSDLRFYPYRDLLRNRIPVCFGSDHPISELSPQAGLLSWQDYLLAQGYEAGEALDRKLLGSFRHFTHDSAHAAGLGMTSGRLVAGSPADIVLFPRDVLKCLREERLFAEVTIVNGEVIYER